MMETGIVEALEKRSGKEPVLAGQGCDSDPGNEVELPAIARRRQYTTEYKLRILAEVDECTEPGQIAALARREGLYSSTICKWKEWRNRMSHQGLDQEQTKRPVDREDPRNKLRRLERENKRLRLKLERAESIIELQKKVSSLLENPSLDGESDASNS
jgi:transposase-like protein